MSPRTGSGFVMVTTVIMPDDLAQLFVEERADACILISSGGRIGFWNRGAECVFGHSREGALNRDLVELIIAGDNRAAIRKTRSLRIVAMTAFAMKGDEQKDREAGCDGCLTKPIDTRAPARQLAAFLPSQPNQP